MTRLAPIPTCAAALLALTMAAAAQTAPESGGTAAGQAPAVPAAPAPLVPPAAEITVAPAAPTPVVPVQAPAVDAQPPAPAVPVQAAPEAPAPAPAATEPTPAAPDQTAPAQAAPEAPAASSDAVSETPAPAPGEAAQAPAGPPEAPAEPLPSGTADPLPPAAEDPLIPAAPGDAVQPLPSPHDLSPLGMYRQADWVVKAVILSLLFACFVTWTVFLFKTVETFVARHRARGAARILTRARSLEEATRTLSGRRDPAAFMAHAVLEEYRTSDTAIDPAGPDGVKERAASLVSRVEVQALARLRRGMGILASVGSTAPFVGLFGTVWGIMNAFIGIAETQTTNLAVVAPGIAEALFATAIGLVAAIPAVVIYNHFTRAIAAYKQALGDAGAATQRLLSRDIDFRNVKGA